MIFVTDAYDAKPRSPREEIEARIRRLKLLLWSDPADAAETRQAIEQAERELRALDRPGGRL